MVKHSSLFASVGLTVLVFVLFLQAPLICRAQYRDPLAVEVALLKALRAFRFPKKYRETELKYIERAFANRSADLPFIRAMYSKSGEEQIAALKAIPSSNPRYADAQWQLHLLVEEPKDKVKHLKAFRQAFQTLPKKRQRPRQQANFENSGMLLIKIMIDSGDQIGRAHV